MKKLMCAVAAVAAGVVFADNGITSANIVGYGPTALEASGRGVCAGASFLNVSGDPVDLTQIRVTGYASQAEYEGGDVEAQTLTYGGGTKKSYFWYDDDDGTAWFWKDDNEEWYEVEAGEVELAPGEGLWVVSQKNTYILQSSGTVPTTADIQTALYKSGRGKVVVNPTPINVDLTDTYVSGYASPSEYEGGDVEAQLLTFGGGTKKSYFWYDDDDGTAWFWKDDNEEWYEVEKNEVVMTPGQGVWVVSQDDTYTFVWPKVDVE